MSSSLACSSSPTQQVSPFIRLYGDAYNSCARFLSLREVDALSKTCTRFRDLTVEVRRQVTDLDLGDFKLTDLGLAQALKIHPRITSLRLVAPILTNVRALAQTLHERALQCIVLSDCSFRGEVWKFLIQRVNVTALEQLHLSKFSPLKGISVSSKNPLHDFERVSLNSLCSQLKVSKSLKSLDLSSLLPFKKHASIDLFLQSLPKSLEEFGYWPIRYSDEQIDFLIQNFPFHNVHRCHFVIGDMSTKKVLELIRLLPFSQMTHLFMIDDTRSLREEVFEELCSKLKDCEKLDALPIYLTKEQSDCLIPLLPATMTELPRLFFNDQGADCLVAKNLSQIKSCHLVGGKKTCPEEKTRQLLKALPLATMSQIKLSLGSPSLTQSNLAYFADQIRKNTVLTILELQGDGEINTVINLLDSLHSTNLHTLTISGEYIRGKPNIPKDIDRHRTTLIAYLQNNLHRWPNIKTLSILVNFIYYAAQPVTLDSLKKLKFPTY